jgi:predicted nucleic acid-binding Zn ribbon protein
MKTVPLHGKKAAGLVALVDDEDYGFVLPFRWNVKESGRMIYAMANVVRGDGSHTTISMHKLITGWPMADHANHDGLDNQRSNLRPATPSQNSMNNRPRRNTSSRYKGVGWQKNQGVWVAHVGTPAGRIYLGIFASEESAARAYDTVARQAFGEYACLNFPDLPPAELPAPKECPVCGAPVPRIRRGGGKYCSPACGKVVHYARQVERRRATRKFRLLVVFV